jgi:hypothetical protein
VDVIHNNPFRILGLPVTASTKEIAKRISDLEMYIEMGKPVSYASDYPFLSPVGRTKDTVQNASNQIETLESRFFYSLFWFWEGNSVDGLAFDVLKEKKVDRAIILLESQRSEGVSRFYSSAKNLSVLYLALARNQEGGGTFSFEKFSQGIMWAGKFLNADFLSEYAELVVGKHFRFEYDEVAEAFIDEIVRTAGPRLSKADRNSLSRFLANFSNYPDKAKRRAIKRFVAKDLEVIDEAIASSEKHRKASPEKSDVAAKNLRRSTAEAIISLQKNLGEDDYTYQSYADKLASAIDACGTEYYNYHFNNETGIDPGETVLEISKYARSLATTLGTKKKIDEGIEIVVKSIERNKVVKHIDVIVRQLNALPQIDTIPENDYQRLLQAARSLVDKCREPLTEMCSVLGQGDDLYLHYSSLVVGSVLGLCIEYVNGTSKTKGAIKILKSISAFDMDEETRRSFRKNNEIIIRNSALETKVAPIHEILTKLNTGQVSNPLKQAKRLLEYAEEPLASLKGVNRQLWLDVSSAVANTALNLCIQYANNTNGRRIVLRKMRATVNIGSILIVMNKISKLSMTQDVRRRLDENRKILKNNLAVTYNPYVSPYRRRSGCYVATMVYGDYDAPQVLVLRQFRDEVLNRLVAGRLFIRVYYWLSPGFVNCFGRFKIVHQGSRYVLDRIVRRLM